MSIEERVSDALVDLRAALGEGAQLEGTLDELAAYYHLKPEVLRVRAERAFGDLHSVQELIAVERIASSREALLRSAFTKYRILAFGLATARNHPVPPSFGQWLEKEFGFSGPEQEDGLAHENEGILFNRDMVKALDLKLNARKRSVR
ncbi:hypothetical protein [Sphingomonas sp. G-3-2-10]|uniref:hypothetical protein n=1 Tax=Sphingomonas sp. G-3-2-10 TaxID=2728838 RepID=UPI00146BF174|nr:hypothetical protein [Sphingomonas sp. G-3-2-10]NML06533.1 hypothetical protein [Sphingomonas sp. G-3-2-10]